MGHRGVDHRATGLPMSSNSEKSSSMVILDVRSPEPALDQPAPLLHTPCARIYATPLPYLPPPSPQANKIIRPPTHFSLRVTLPYFPRGFCRAVKTSPRLPCGPGSPAPQLSGSPVESGVSSDTRAIQMQLLIFYGGRREKLIASQS